MSIIKCEVGGFEPAATKIKDKLNNLANEVSDLIDNECRKDKYYFKLGFVDGLSSVAKHPHHADAIKLSQWSDKVWEKASQLKDAVENGDLDIDSITIKNEMPPI